MTELAKQKCLEDFELLTTEYIKLLNDKDVLVEWGKPQLEALYTMRVGHLQIERLKLQLAIKALKRKIELVQSAFNREQPVDLNEVELQVAFELAEVEASIMKEVSNLENAKQLLTHLGTPENSAELRKVYRQLAKQLHPDVNPTVNEKQITIWHLVKEAYECCDLDRLKILQLVFEKEILAAKAQVQEYNFEDLGIRMEVLKEGIKLLQQEIIVIRNEFPFTVEHLIKDEQWVEVETQKIQEQLDHLRQYESELIIQYNQLLFLL